LEQTFTRSILTNNDSRGFSDWESLYGNQQVESMPWYSEKLDPDLNEEISNGKLSVKGRFLDLGTGPATQAVQVAKQGFTVTGSDISKSAIYRAMKVYANEPNIIFIVDNILDSRIKDDEYDYIFDRGCFHVFQPVERPRYVREIKRILKKDGMLFLKCFSTKEKRDEGPYRFSKKQLSKIFENEEFKIERIKETVYQGTLDPLPKALFVVLTNHKSITRQ
jgi:SAM-dependent methyltransferase